MTLWEGLGGEVRPVPPRPLAFKTLGTIASQPESELFLRIPCIAKSLRSIRPLGRRVLVSSRGQSRAHGQSVLGSQAKHPRGAAIARNCRAQGDLGESLAREERGGAESWS